MAGAADADCPWLRGSVELSEPARGWRSAIVHVVGVVGTGYHELWVNNHKAES